MIHHEMVAAAADLVLVQRSEVLGNPLALCTVPPVASSPVTGVDFATVFVRDYEVASEFYGGLLGLERSADYGKVPGGEFETGNLTLQVMDAAAIGREFEPRTHPLAFHVDDVEATRSELEAKGVTFLADTIDSGVCLMAPFSDPDGNVLMLHNRYAPKS
jgi:predicted enzyme related to lactoylglutathione lyase